MNKDITQKILLENDEAEFKKLVLSHINEIDGITLFNKKNSNPILKSVQSYPVGSVFTEKLYNFVHGNTEIKTCEVCNTNKVKWQGNLKKAYYLTCSAKCFPKHPQYQKNYANAINEKYGVSNVAKSEIVQRTIKETLVKRYGVDSIFKTEKSKDALKKNSLEKYGVEHHLKSPEVHRAIKNTYFKNLWDVKRSFIEKFAQPLFNIDEFKSVYETRAWECVKCRKEFDDTLCHGYPRCPRCERMNGRSNQEREVYEFICSLVDESLVQISKHILVDGKKRRQLDIFIPHLNLGIEFNGIYWHSINAGTDKNYHVDKLNMATKQGIRLIQIFEDEWQHKKELIQSRLLNVLNITKQTFYARKCTVREITSRDAMLFFEANHLQGNARATVYLGLFHDNKLVSAMSFGRPRFNKKITWELIRFTSIINANVVGGASKLFTHFLKVIAKQGDTIVSYCNRCWGEGNVYKQLGFKFIKSTAPAIWYSNKKQMKRMSRVLFQKHKLKQLLENFDPNLTEQKNMIMNGYLAIPDCGNNVYEFTVE